MCLLKIASGMLLAPEIDGMLYNETPSNQASGTLNYKLGSVGPTKL